MDDGCKGKDWRQGDWKPTKIRSSSRLHDQGGGDQEVRIDLLAPSLNFVN